MKNRIFPILLSIALLCFFAITFMQLETKSPVSPAPTNGSESRVEESSDSQDQRKAWIESMHRSAPDVNWRVLEQDYRQKRLEKRKSQASPRTEVESLANGQLEGIWKERGSRNQAGSVLVTDYDVEQDKIYTISAGGTLWKGGRNNEGWEVVNDDIRLDNQFFKLISDGQGGQRLLAAINGLPHYSDDDGQNWTKSEGVLLLDDNAKSRNLIVLADSAQTIYMMTKSSYWNRYRLFKSTDHGLNFDKLERLESHADNDLHMIQAVGTNDIYLITKESQSKTTLAKLNLATSEFELVREEMEDLAFEDGRANICGAMINNELTFYSYQRDTVLMRTTDIGENWEEIGILPKRPWGVGMYILPSNPELMIFGEVDLYKSFSGGDFWDLQNSWGEYYDAPTEKLHADMMYFAEYVDPEGEAFLLISNHGGLNISYNELGTTPSISVDGLNVGQFYDVVTDPLDSRYIYGGTQDQGFQKAIDDRRNEVLNFEQEISGDYGHLTFGLGGQTLWMVYPNGWITHYSYPRSDGYDSSWSLTTRNRSAWIPPMMSDPDPNRDIVYLAGGDDKENSNQSYIFKLEYDGNFGINSTKMPFDFQNATDGDISALEMSLLNTDKWYAATSDGRFFYSVDRGTNWEQTIDFVPGGHYLYGATILASSQDDQTVYYGGSGYSNPAVYKSTNGGESFVDISTGLPPTLVFELASNADESMLFAATEAGPFVYIAADNQWYDMTGQGAPAQTYWSVEFVEDRNLIRFGTYGRGIWDFAIDELVGTQPIPLAKALRLSPNPSRGQFQLELPEAISPEASIQITDLSGRQVAQWTFEQVATDERHASITVNDLAVGTYIVSAKEKDQLYSGQLVLIAQ